ncbi:MAG: Xaa-Pro dipeptidase [Gammaproteobacteria bacterium]|nr:Xaa-Pro dipeptidase [Gammaproteobacteria bacterium]MDH3505588.1 Xaa-Pro dipeptidase [Gammaproteobacteria bacterium]
MNHDEALDDLYPAHLKEWAARFEAALEATGFDSAVILAGSEQAIFRDDNTYPFVAEPYFKAWVPLSHHPDSAIHFVPGQRPRLIYFQHTGFWHAPPEPPAGTWLEYFELECIDKLAAHTAALGTLTGRVAAIGPPHDELGGAMIWNDATLLAALDFRRAYKTSYEIACMAEANAIAARGHVAARQAYENDASEFMIHQAYCDATAQRETELPYLNIVALNEHAAVLHYQHLAHTQPRTPSSFLIDAGASCNGYASDVTRTYSRDSSAMQALIDSVDALQQEICSRVEAGLDFVALNETAHALLAEVLHTHGLIRCTAEEAQARGITRTFLPHGLGHLLGLQVHDAGGHMAGADGSRREPPLAHPMLRLTRTLEPGFVVTIEPGLYFIPSLLEALRASEHTDAIDWREVDALSRFGGIRIEDDVLVTESGPRNLSRPALERACV